MKVDLVEEYKKKDLGKMDKKDAWQNLMLYLSTEMNFLKKLEPTPFVLGRMNQLVMTIDIMCVISARCGLDLNVDGHSIIHEKKKMDMYRKLAQ